MKETLKRINFILSIINLILYIVIILLLVKGCEDTNTRSNIHINILYRIENPTKNYLSR